MEASVLLSSTHAPTCGSFDRASCGYVGRERERERVGEGQRRENERSTHTEREREKREREVKAEKEQSADIPRAISPALHSPPSFQHPEEGVYLDKLDVAAGLRLSGALRSASRSENAGLARGWVR